MSIVEMTYKLPVICAVSDGASANRKFFKIHGFMDDAVSEVVYHTINLYADKELWYIYFYADPPHLLKTTRNCLHHSGPSGTRKMETGIGYICGNTSVPCLWMTLIVTREKCSNYRWINLSSVANPGTAATAQYCMMFNRFFDCLNVRSLYEALP